MYYLLDKNYKSVYNPSHDWSKNTSQSFGTNKIHNSF